MALKLTAPARAMERRSLAPVLGRRWIRGAKKRRGVEAMGQLAEGPRRMRRLLGLCLLVLGVGCGESSSPGAPCPAIATAGLDVGVASATTGQALCGATVTARDGGYVETLTPMSCRYLGAFERPATYTVRAESVGFRALEANVRVSMGTGQCPHVKTVLVELELAPTP